ncbi:MAG: hypothetical protein ACI8W3_001243 [Myxococcota bacterium]|jgi:hypothetical protein
MIARHPTCSIACTMSSLLAFARLRNQRHRDAAALRPLKADVGLE